jgi:GNAT superfamily N-acetyltransferase
MKHEINIRTGKKEDLSQVLALVRELAIYERAENEVENTVEMMVEDGFGPHPIYGFFVAETADKIIGLALYYYRYSTWKGKCIYLEDIIVTESYRGAGVGRKLLDKLVEKAREVNARRLTWQVLDWNEPAINFYKKVGASLDAEWVNCTLTREQIEGWTSKNTEKHQG